MSLNWDIRDVADEQAIKTDEEWPLTEGIIFLTMATGIGHLTEKSAPEFYARASFLEMLNGTPYFVKNGEPYSLTPTDIRKRIGLKTNVFPEETRAAWQKRIAARELDDRVRRYTTEAGQ